MSTNKEPRTATDSWEPALVEFAPLQPDDLDLMRKWLNTGPARRWYSKQSRSLADITSSYLPRIRGEEPTQCFIIIYSQKPIGHVQTYIVADHPEYERYVKPGKATAGLDIFIGEEDFCYRGLGPVIMTEFLARVIFANPSVERCIVGPEPGNKAAIRAYERVGFRYLKTVELPFEEQPEHIMVLERRVFQQHVRPGP